MAKIIETYGKDYADNKIKQDVSFLDIMFDEMKKDYPKLTINEFIEIIRSYGETSFDGVSDIKRAALLMTSTRDELHHDSKSGKDGGWQRTV